MLLHMFFSCNIYSLILAWKLLCPIKNSHLCSHTWQPQWYYLLTKVLKLFKSWTTYTIRTIQTPLWPHWFRSPLTRRGVGWAIYQPSLCNICFSSYCPSSSYRQISFLLNFLFSLPITSVLKQLRFGATLSQTTHCRGQSSLFIKGNCHLYFADFVRNCIWVLLDFHSRST